MDLQAAVTAHSSTELYVTNLEYHEESVGHKGTMPIITARCRDSDGTFHQIEIDGFRPFFAITTEEFWSDPKGVCADRHVHAVEGCFTDPPDDIISSSEFEQVSVADVDTGSRIADALSELTGTPVVHRETPPAQTLTDEPVVRIYTEVPGDVSDMREHFEQTYEADVPFTRRFATATGVVPGMRVESTDRRLTYQNITTDGSQPIQELDECEAPDVSPRVCIFDIETETPDEGFPDPDRAKQRITAISAYDSYTNEYKLWTLRSPQWKFDGHSLDDVARQAVQETEDRLNITLNEDVNTDADAASRSQSIVFDDEEALIESFHEWYLDRNFDMITGWNSNLFDIPYIIQRSYNRSVTQMYDWYEHSNPGVWKQTRGDDEQLNFSLDGVSTLDMLDAYSKTQYRALDSKRLEDVAQDEVGFGKIDLDVDSYDDAWHNRPIDFLVYNVRDTQAVAEIERTSSLLDLYDNIRSVTTTLYETCNSNGQALDTMFLRFAYRNDIALPTNTAPDENVYHGAKVFETVPGYHPNAVYPDLSSLYPSLFAMLNLGVGTIIGDREALADSEYGEDDVFRFPVDDRPFARLEKGVSYDHLDRDTYKGVKTPDGNLREMFDPAFQWRFVLKPDIKESFIKGTIDELIDMKNQYTGGMYESVKRITNSCYGVVGNSETGGVGSRMYNRYVAEGITLAGQLTIKHTAREFTEYIQEHYDSEATLIGGDTDSSVTSIPNADSLEQVQTWAQDAVAHVDESYDEFAEEMFWMDPEDDTHRLEVELESVASGLFFIESDDSDVEYVENNDGYLVRVEETTGVQKRYAQHIVWDDDDGWIDTPDADEYPGDALSDSADLSAVKQQQTCTHETYTTGPLNDRDATADISISGFEYVRSDTATITKQVQLRVLTDILLATDTESKIEPYLQDVVADIRNGEYELSALARPKGVSQPLDEYGWVDLEDAKADEITDRVRSNEGLYRQRAGPTYRGAKYANDHIDGENITTGTKPVKIPIETIRDDGSTYPHAYQYESYPTDGRPSPPEVGDPVDAVAVEDTSNLPTDVFIPDYDTMITKSVRDPIESMLKTINLDWEEIQSTGTQSGLDQWT